MKTSKTSSRKTPTQKAKERLNASMASTQNSAQESPRANLPANTKPVKVVEAPLEEPPVVNAPAFKEWRITTFSDMADVDHWFQDKLIYILNHLLRKGRILKRKLIEFTYPEKGLVRIVWQDLVTGETIHEGGATGGVVTDEEDPLA